MTTLLRIGDAQGHVHWINPAHILEIRLDETDSGQCVIDLGTTAVRLALTPPDQVLGRLVRAAERIELP